MDDNNQRVLVEYTGRLEDGTVFESSEESGAMDITIGAGQVIKGIDEALAEMEVGETRTITIPCEKAWGFSTKEKSRIAAMIEKERQEAAERRMFGD